MKKAVIEAYHDYTELLEEIGEDEKSIHSIKAFDNNDDIVKPKSSWKKVSNAVIATS